MDYFKAKLKRGLTNVAALLAISTIGLAIYVIGLLAGYSELAGLGFTVIPVGLAGAVIFFWFPFIVPEWYEIPTKSNLNKEMQKEEKK
jgi:hypothetical protein